MIISTRGRYALRVMLDLADHCDGGFVPMKDVAQRQDVSLKYLERIMPALSRNGLVEGVHGKGGGYRLTRAPEQYVVGEILRLTEGDLAPVSCVESNAVHCDQHCGCRTYPMWKELDRIINEYLDGVTLRDLLNNGGAPREGGRGKAAQ